MQTVSMFSVPVSDSQNRRLFAVVPQPTIAAFARLEASDAIWRRGEQGGVRHEGTWEVNDDYYRVRLRDRAMSWVK